MKTYSFGKSRKFALAFAWNEANGFGNKVKVSRESGSWIVRVVEQRKQLEFVK